MHAPRSVADERFRALADPIRRDILTMVAHHEAPAGEIAERFQITRPAVSRHLRVLRGAGLVVVREDGTSRFYKSDRDALANLGRWFDSFWERRLPTLKMLAEQEARDEN